MDEAIAISFNSSFPKAISTITTTTKTTKTKTTAAAAAAATTTKTTTTTTTTTKSDEVVSTAESLLANTRLSETCASFHQQASEATATTGRPVEKDCLMSYLATFPGSGSEMCLELIQGMTGIKTGHAYPILVKNSHNNKSQKVVVLKTHYPNKMVRGGNPEHNPVHVRRTILLLRHPMHALPSFFNFISERQTQQRRHTQQAPLQEWISWRDANFSSKLYMWRFHLDFWLSQYHLVQSANNTIMEDVILSFNKKKNNNNNNNKNIDMDDASHKRKGNKTMILVRYEDLIHPLTGPIVLQEMGTFLQQNDNVTTIVSPDQVPCLWHYIVVQRRAKKRSGESNNSNNKANNNNNSGNSSSTSSSSTRYVPPYRNEQLAEIAQMLRHQRFRYRTVYPQLDAVFADYLDHVQKRLRQQQPPRKKKRNKKSSESTSNTMNESSYTS